MIEKVLRYAEKMGLDKQELLEMTMIEALIKIEETKDMWSDLRKQI
jgi:hypothetical protein